MSSGGEHTSQLVTQQAIWSLEGSQLQINHNHRFLTFINSHFMWPLKLSAIQILLSQLKLLYYQLTTIFRQVIKSIKQNNLLRNYSNQGQKLNFQFQKSLKQILNSLQSLTYIIYFVQEIKAQPRRLSYLKMQPITRNQLQPYPQFNLSMHLLKHQQQMLKFLFFTQYDIILQSFELKHASYMSSSKRGYPVQQFNKAEEIQRHFRMISQKLHIRLVRDMDLDKLLDRLQKLWQAKNVPVFHRYYVQKYFYSAFVKNVESLIQAEQKLIKQERHIFYTIYRTINARQACLRQLKKHLAQLNIQDVYEYLHIARQRFFNQKKKTQHQKYLRNGYKVKIHINNPNQPTPSQSKVSKCKVQHFSDNFNHLCKLTIYSVQQIIKWKQYIYSLTHDTKKKRQRLEYIYFQQNYFLKILHDTSSFLKVSFLGKFYKFAQKNDPFMLWPVLAFEKQATKYVDGQLLKKVFMPQSDMLSQILSKVQVLAQEYKWNIRSRRGYDINVLKRSTTDNQEKRRRTEARENLERQPLANSILKKLQGTTSKRANSLKNFRVREHTKQKQVTRTVSNHKVLIESTNSPKKRRGYPLSGLIRTVLQVQKSPLKNSVIRQKNKANPLQHSQISDDLLKQIKQQVVRKVKLDFQNKSPNQNPISETKDYALQMYINSRINQAIKGIFPFQPENSLKPPIQLQSIRIAEGKIGAQISLMIKDTIQNYAQMQFRQGELLKQIQKAPYVYFLRAKCGQQYLGMVVVTLQKQNQNYKTLKTLYIGFNDISQLQMLITQTVRFLQEYENAFQVHFPFFQPSDSQPIRQLLSTLQQTLTSEKANNACIITQKQLYSSISQQRFIFKRQGKNIEYFPNRYPGSIHFKLQLIHSQKKLFLQKSSKNIQRQYEKKIFYGLLFAEMLRKVHNNPDELNILKEKSMSKQMFKYLVDSMMMLQKGTEQIFGHQGKRQLRFIQSVNMSELNKQLSKLKQPYPYLQLSDSLKTSNRVHSLTMDLSFQLAYPVVKSILNSRTNQMWHRISIREEIQVLSVQQTTFYKLPLIQGRQGGNASMHHQNIMRKSLVLFPAEQFSQDLQEKQLSTFLVHCLLNQTNRQVQKTKVNQLWVPMLRYPQKYHQRQELFMPTHRLNDLQQLKEELFIAEFFEWWCDMQLQNGIEYQAEENIERNVTGRILLKKPLGIAVMAEDSKNRIILYGKVFEAV